MLRALHDIYLYIYTYIYIYFCDAELNNSNLIQETFLIIFNVKKSCAA